MRRFSSKHIYKFTNYRINWAHITRNCRWMSVKMF